MAEYSTKEDFAAGGWMDGDPLQQDPDGDPNDVQPPEQQDIDNNQQNPVGPVVMAENASFERQEPD